MKVEGTEIKEQDLQRIVAELTRPGVRFSFNDVKGLFIMRGYKQLNHDRAADRLLQKLRRRGAIEYRGKGIWLSTSWISVAEANTQQAH